MALIPIQDTEATITELRRAKAILATNAKKYYGID
jgi:hypothetical protein